MIVIYMNTYAKFRGNLWIFLADFAIEEGYISYIYELDLYLDEIQAQK